MTSVRTFVPTYHGDGRADWTFAVAITYKDTVAMIATARARDRDRPPACIPIRPTFNEESFGGFEMVEAHWTSR